MIIEEGKVKIKIKKLGKISKEMDVFYNPIMEYNRAISVKLLNKVKDKDMQIALPLSGTGIRGIRFLKELDKGKIKRIVFNDYSKDAIKNIKANLKLNKLKISRKIVIENKDANLFLLESTGFDYIDIDPFGSPNVFLDSAVKRLSRNGILAVTATDTAPLAGTFPKVCMRKYWAQSLHSKEMHEIGLRILIRKVQLIAGQYEKALIPLYSYYKDHYFRIFFRCVKGKKNVDSVIEQHGMYKEAGPLWLGKLKTLRLDDELDILGFYDIHYICKKNKLKIPKKEELIKTLNKKGFKATGTHFSGTGIKSNVKEKELIKIIRQLF